MMRLIYNLVFPLVLLATLPCYLARMLKRGGYRQDFGQRFARYSPDLRARFARGEWIWIHAVSVGELLAALKILEELHRRQPSWRFVVSSSTSTAHAIALEKQKDWWTPIYTPLDLPMIVCRALDTVRPRAVVLTESEMWPNFVWSAARRGLPIALVNARVSPRSARRYRRFATAIQAVTRHLSRVGLQEPEHADLWAHLGVAAPRRHITGSVKYDPTVADQAPRNFAPVLHAWGIPADDPILIAGSTHEGEEEILADALKKLRTSHPSARLLIAPRHVERSAHIQQRLTGAGWNIALRSAAPLGNAPDILLIDTTGELRDWYAVAQVVFIGKSLCGVGGQNPVEAIQAGRPVLFGPHMENFAELRAALEANGGAMRVTDAESLAKAASRLLQSPARGEYLVERANEALAPHRGATARTAALVEEMVKGSD
jgi:3-deoxy-D-manno-octulosonic-acid transferase